MEIEHVDPSMSSGHWTMRTNSPVKQASVCKLSLRSLVRHGSGRFRLLALLLFSIGSQPLALADIVPYFRRPPKEPPLSTLYDFIRDISTVELFVVVGCLIAAMEAVFFVGFLWARRRHVDE